MNNRSFLFLSLTAIVFLPPALVSAQTETPPPVFTRPRTVSGAQEPRQAQPTPTPEAAPSSPATDPDAPARQSQTPATAATPAPQPASTPAPSVTTPGATVTPAAPLPAPAVPLQPARPLPVSRFRTRGAEAQQLLKSRLTLTAMTPSLAYVTIAAYDQDASKIHLLTVPKQTFLTRGAEVTLTTPQGLPVRLQVVRPNYVNTAVVISDMTGRQLTPLVVEYPIEKFGSFREMAYYTSAHPALLSHELVRHGQSYVRTMIELAAKRLKDKGRIISPEIVDIAERLCIVEHVDHDRFRREDRKRLYEEVYTLFALNELDTYRYSVSSAGAGGMVQMIPSTYQMVRRMHPSVGLNPDFVAGMRNHGNALEAMLLYMQDTWRDLALRQDVLDALAGNTATQPELAAAGYNSNPARLPLYLRRGGPAWRTLIPRETQVYLQIYASVESLMFAKDAEGRKGR